jgi:pyruvate kinase
VGGTVAAQNPRSRQLTCTGALRVCVEQEKDKQDIMWGLGSGMDFLAVSFCQSAADVRYVREFLGRQANNVKIIAKIENQQGVDEIEDIISEADGVMVARGDLGMEVPLEKLINIQVRFLPVATPL